MSPSVGRAWAATTLPGRCGPLRQLPRPGSLPSSSPACSVWLIQEMAPGLRRAAFQSACIKSWSCGPYYNDQKKRLQLKNGSSLWFGSAPHAKDLADFYTTEWADIMIEEAQTFLQSEIESLTASNRCTSNHEITPKMVTTFMPGRTEEGIPPRGLPYLKRVFIDGIYRDEEKRFCGPDGRWAFIQAFSWDNIEWARKELTRDGVGIGAHNAADPDCPCQDCTFYAWSDPQRREYFLTRTEYGATLLGLTDKDLREAWLYGKWDIFEGQYFPHFSRERHVRPHGEVLALLKPWYTYWLSGDWGYDHPHAVYLNAMDEHKRVLTFGELWGRKVGETDLGRAITAKCAGYKFRSFTFSWDAGKLSARAPAKFPKSISQLISEALGSGIPKPAPADSSPGSRIARARLTSQVLESDSVIISDDCKRLIECLPTLVRDPENTEDVMKMDFSENGIGDDTYDGWSMGLQHMLGTTKPARAKMEEALQAVRQGFVARPEPVKPGVDPFAQFGGKKL